ncbi:MAG: DMT family transporter [Candidatus Eremiobacteraeota bacterium]|nr:DMT family transporter [Candidatus Eremiobacteraeota bacterium]
MSLRGSGTGGTRVTLSRYAVLAIGIAGLSMAGVLYKLASAPTIAVVAYRMIFAVVMMAPLVAISRASTNALRRAPIARSDIAAAALSGTLFAFDVTLWALSLQFTSISSAALLVSMDPIFVAVFAALIFGERPSWPMVAGMAIAVFGAAVITVGDFRISGRALIGDALALSAAFAETGYLLLGRHVRQRVDTVRYSLIVYSACAVCVWLALFVLRVPAAISRHDLVVCAVLALLATVLGHTLVSKSLGHMPAAVVAISFLSQPIMTALFAYLVLHQIVAPLTAIGGTIALVGIGVVAFANERSVASGPPQAI